MVFEIVGGFVAVLVVVVLVAYVVTLYNRLVSLDKRADQAKQNIDVLLEQRQDELGKLIETAKEFMDFEREVLTQLTEARELAERASTPSEEAAADQRIQQALSTFRARVEDYPELRSQRNVLQLQERISTLEDRIADRREVYNEVVTQYNTRIEQFPYVLFARQFGYHQRELFEASEDARADVDVGELFA